MKNAPQRKLTLKVEAEEQRKAVHAAPVRAKCSGINSSPKSERVPAIPKDGEPRRDSCSRARRELTRPAS